MRRILLLVALAAGVAVVAIPSAGALTFPDDICPVRAGTVIRVCPQGETGKFYSYQLKGRDGTGCTPYVKFRMLNSALPPGLSLSSDGLISGTPTQAGTWDFWISMQDDKGAVSWCNDDESTEREFEMTIVQGLNIVQRQSSLPPAQLGTAYSFQFTATGGTPTWAVSSGALPAGINLDANSGKLSGTPTAIGDSTFKITATAGSRTDTQTYSMSVVAPLKITKSSTVAEAGIAFTLTPTATGGKAGYTWTLTGTLPTGLTLDPATGSISGTPTVPGSTPLTLTVKDTLGLQTTVAFKLVVVQHIALVRESLPQGTVGTNFGWRFAVTGGVRPRRFALIGGRQLPAGLKLDRVRGRITGTPRKAGTFRIRLQVTDKLGGQSSVGFVLKVVK
jgi:large repetitive protein